MRGILRKYAANFTVEDKVVLTRFTVGFLYGLTVFIASFYVNPVDLSPFAWAMSIMVYYFTTLYVSLKYKPSSKVIVYLRGLATFYGTWLLTAILLNEFSLTIGIKH